MHRSARFVYAPRCVFDAIGVVHAPKRAACLCTEVRGLFMHRGARFVYAPKCVFVYALRCVFVYTPRCAVCLYSTSETYTESATLRRSSCPSKGLDTAMWSTARSADGHVSDTCASTLYHCASAHDPRTTRTPDFESPRVRKSRSPPPFRHHHCGPKQHRLW